MVVILLCLFVFGLFIGSFYNVVALRLPKNESIVFPGSHCVKCNHLLTWYELIPVFSYLFLRGKCKNCHTHISWQYPLVEILTGLLFALSFYIFGFSYNTLIAIILSSVVIITYISDAKYMIILDEIIYIGAGLIILIYIFQGNIIGVLNHLIGAAIIFFILLLVKFLGDRAFKQESLGLGDVKFSLLAGLLLGVKVGIIYIILGSFLAFPYAIYITIKNKEGILPFGPFLATSLLILFFNYEWVLNYINIFLGV